MRRFGLTPLAIAALILLLSLNGSLLIWLSHIMTSEGEVDVAAADWAPQRSDSSEKDAPPSIAPNLYPTTLSRPVFFKDRRPFVPPPPPAPTPQIILSAPPPAPPVPEPDLVLAGVTIGADVKKAYLVSKTNTEGVWVEQGEVVEGWRVGVISNADIALHNAGRTLQLFLYERAQ